MAVINTIVVNKQESDSCKDTEKEIKNNEIDFDDLLSSAGELGRYQMFLIIATIPFYFYGVVVYFTQLFLTEVSPNHWCWIPELVNLTDIQRRNLAIPTDESRFGYSHCTAYVANWTDVLLTGMKPDQTWNTTKCQHGWEFNKTELPYPTITSELEWVCDKNSYPATAQSVFFAGSIIGSFIIGRVADRFGRLPATVISCVVGCVGGIISTFARDFTEFALCRFLMGFAYDNCMMMVYLLVLEYIAPKYRTVVANVSFAMFYSSSVTIFPWIALACGHWKTLSLVTSITLGFGVLAPLIIPESPRWMVSKGRVDSAVNKVLTIARINRKEVPIKLIEEFKSSVAATKQEKNKSVLELLRRPVLRKMYICICLEYICCSLIFDVLVRSIGQLDFDFFISFSVISFTELPSLILLGFIMDWMGRRWLAATSYAMGCLFCLLIVFIGGGLPSVICAIIARFFINMAYGAAMQWAAEMLPTPVRGSGLSVVHICGLFGTLSSPYIVYLETFVYWLPYVIVAFIAAFGVVISLILPETARKDMPQTFDDAEELIKNQRFFDAPCLRKVEDDGQINVRF